jgi:general secretion pathway protein D
MFSIRMRIARAAFWLALPLGLGLGSAAQGEGSAPDSNSVQILKTAEELNAERQLPSAKPRSVATTQVGEDGGITLNFINADVRDVARAVLGDFLGLNYEIGNVQGTVTIQTSRPLTRAEVLPALETSLGLNGLALVRRGNTYKVMVLADAPRQSGVAPNPRRGEAGYGIEIVPLRYINAAKMQSLLEPLVPSQAIIHADADRNFLVIEGSGPERSAMIEEVALFDVDWLEGVSFDLLTPRYTDARNLAKELNAVLGGGDNPLSGVVRIVPIQRLNAVLVVSRQPRYLAQLKTWMERLDQPGKGSDRRVFVYPVRNGDASDLADVLKHVLFGDTDADQDVKPDEADIDNFHDTPPPPRSPDKQAPSTHSTVAGDTTITVDKNRNALVIYSTPQQYAELEAALRQLDVAPVQVQLEAAIAEVSLNDGLQYGVQYFYQPSDNHQIVLSNSKDANIVASFPGFSYMFTEGTNIRVILSALSNVTHVEVVSSPEVMVLNKRTATLQVGQQVPIATAQAVSVSAGAAPFVNTIEYHATGVILKDTPSVDQSGMVTMTISQEVSNVSADSASPLDSPTFEQRRIRSTVAVHDNETVALGGLISSSKTRGSSGIPFLSEIPVLGALFGTKKDTGARTELMVLITPHVIADLGAARAITDELRREFPHLEPLLRKRGQ